MKPRYLFKDGRVSQQETLYHLLTDTSDRASDHVVLLVLRSELDNRPAAAQGPATAEFDAFRAQMTRNINTLQSQVQNLQQQLDAR